MLHAHSVLPMQNCYLWTPPTKCLGFWKVLWVCVCVCVCVCTWGHATGAGSAGVVQEVQVVRPGRWVGEAQVGQRHVCSQQHRQQGAHVCTPHPAGYRLDTEGEREGLSPGVYTGILAATNGGSSGGCVRVEAHYNIPVAVRFLSIPFNNNEAYKFTITKWECLLTPIKVQYFPPVRRWEKQRENWHVSVYGGAVCSLP